MTPTQTPEGDTRFADLTWREHPLYRRAGQAYLAWVQARSGAQRSMRYESLGAAPGRYVSEK